MTDNLYDKLDESFQGVIVLSGMPGSGKTTAAMTIAKPSKQVVLDFDLKDETRCMKLGIPYFRPTVENLKSATDYDLQGILKWTEDSFKEIAALGKTGRNTLIIDNGSPLEAAFAYAVEKDPGKYGVNAKNAASGAYGGVNPGVSVLWQNIVKYFMSNGFSRIVVCMHMSQSWANGIPMDKMKVKGNKILTQLSNLSVILVKSNMPNKPPVGLIGKEALGLLHFDDKTEKYSIMMAIPPRVPEFDWPHVFETLKQMELGTKTSFDKDETWSMKEVEHYSPWLSDAQRDFIITIAKNPNFTLNESDEAITGEKLPLIPSTEVKVEQPIVDWNALTQYAMQVNGMSVTDLKLFIKTKFGGYKATDTSLYFDALKKETIKIPEESLAEIDIPEVNEMENPNVED